MEKAERVILVIDDNTADVELLARMLNRIGVNARVEPLTTGTAAINYLAGNKPYNDRAKYPLPRVAFLDMKMPDISGLDVLRWINSQPGLRRLVVIVHSGYAGTKQIEELYAAGANSFLRKTNDTEELRHLVEYFKGHFTE